MSFVWFDSYNLPTVVCYRKEDYERLKRSLRFKRSLKLYEKLFATKPTDNQPVQRRKRQSSTADGLCRTRSQYTEPKAALNNQGNWMYVANMPEVDNRISQLVKTETCLWVKICISIIEIELLQIYLIQTNSHCILFVSYCLLSHKWYYSWLYHWYNTETRFWVER